MTAPKAARVEEFLRRLAGAPPASSAEEALTLVNTLLNQVEDELSGVPYDPEAARQLVTDGRLYGPHESFASHWKARSDLLRYAHAQHDTFVQANGAVLVRVRRPAVVLLSKAGADGVEVTL